MEGSRTVDAPSGEEPAGTEPVIRFVLVERCAITRHALRRICAALPHIDIGTEGCATGDACRAVDHLGRVVVLLGPSITIDECLGLQAEITLSYPSSTIVTIQSQLQPEHALRLVRQGVAGILDEQASEQDLIIAIGVIAAGQPFISRQVRALLNEAPRRASQPRQPC
jgi:DNA-binding NarL/FixJ family response regulator